MVAEPLAGASQRVDDAALARRVDVVAVEVLLPVGLQQPVQARRVGAATGHAVDVGERFGHVVHHGRSEGSSVASPGRSTVADFVAAIDQGTTSTRCMIFDHDGAEVGRHQLEHEQIMPRAGWVEHNPVEIWERTASVIAVGAQQDEPVRRRSGGPWHHQST